MFITILTYVMSAMAVWSLYLMGNKNKYGPIIGVLNQVMWIYYVIATEEWGLMLGVACYTIIHVRNTYKWVSEEIKNNNALFYMKEIEGYEGLTLLCSNCDEELDSNYPAYGFSCYNCGAEIKEKAVLSSYKWDEHNGWFLKK